MNLSLPDLALKRPITITMLVITMICLGGIALVRLPLEFIPGMDLPFVVAVIPYPGATPEQVENEIAIPAEGEFRTLSHLRRITTTSDSDGCRVRMEFDWDTNMGLATAEVRDRMERLRLRLPSAVDRIYLQRFSAQSVPVMVFTLFSLEEAADFTHNVRTQIEPRLMRLDGVAEVAVFGQEEPEVLVEFDQDALRRSNLALYDVVNRLQESNLNLAIGELPDGQNKFFVRALDEYHTPEGLSRQIIGPHGMRLDSVAEVGYGRREQEQHYSIDGQSGTFVMIRKESEANTVATCRAINEELDQILGEPEFADTQAFIFFDQSEIILSALDGLVEAGRWGALLAISVLFFFLMRLRPTLAVTLVIPASLLGGLVFMFFTNMSINLVTMTSMIIAVGMLVDNAIVVIENIYRHRQLGLDPMASAREGASEVGLAITSATCTTLVVFIPVVYMQTGEMATYMRQFAGPVSVSLITSLLLALTVIPLAASRMRERRHLPGYALAQRVRARVWPAEGRRREPSAAGRLFRNATATHPVKRLVNVYTGCLRWAMRWRLATVTGIALIGGVTVAVPVQHVGVDNMQQMSTREVNINVNLDQNFDMEMASEVFDRLESVINKQRDELGLKNVFTNYSRTGGRISIYLIPPGEYPPGKTPKYNVEDVLNILWQRLPEQLPGVELRFSIPELAEGEGRSISVRMRGDDTRLLNQYAERFRDLMEDLPNVTDVQTGADRSRQEMQIRMDKDLVAQAGVTPVIVAQTVDFALRGTRLPYMKQGGREVPVWAQFREEDRQTRANLDRVDVMNPMGELVPLNRLVDYQREQSPQAIRRVNGKNVVSVSGQVSGENMLAIQRDVRRLVDAFQLPQGYSIEFGDEFREIQDNIVNFVTALLLAVILIYLVMGALFESYVLPLSILTSVPLAFVGVYWALYITGTSWDIIAFIGCILMAGIVVNNGIVIVDYINRLRNRGLDRFDAIIAAGRDRFRPVFMTAITTILGCVPLALGGSGAGGGHIAFNSLGWALIGGLTTGTALTLFIVPLFYTFIDDIRFWFRDYWSNMASIGSGRPPNPKG